MTLRVTLLNPMRAMIMSAAPPCRSGDSAASVMTKGKKIIRIIAARFIALLIRSASRSLDARSPTGDCPARPRAVPTRAQSVLIGRHGAPLR
ncbi:hypothetical protein BMG523Draft_04177 [Frankia sp. BMG5.23]|nr:hypothetical protein BMG523Draft_04177 [Frankia sp. BMG5.23]